MILKSNLEIEYYSFENLSGYNNFTHIISTRNTILGKSLNLSFNVNDDLEKVKTNRKIIGNHFGIFPNQLFLPVQCHTNNIGVVEQNKIPSLGNTDALITNIPGICIGVLAADCVPILIFDKQKKVIAAVHAGWKGTIKKIAMETVWKMQRDFNCHPGNLSVGIGPSISIKNYEVGQEVINAFFKQFPNDAHKFVELKNKEKGNINLWEANKIQLENAGVLSENIEVSGICTFDNADTFFSARKEGFNTGRFGAFIMLKQGI